MAINFNLKKRNQAQKPAQESRFKKAIHFIFVHNILYKLLALGTAIAAWLITVALT